MSAPLTRLKRSRSRKRNFIAKRMFESKQFRKKVHIDQKLYERLNRVSKKELLEDADEEGEE